MAEKGYYLHFRNEPQPHTLAVLKGYGVKLEPVFETSFDITSSLSLSDLKHVLKKECCGEEFCLIKPATAFVITELVSK